MTWRQYIALLLDQASHRPPVQILPAIQLFPYGFEYSEMKAYLNDLRASWRFRLTDRVVYVSKLHVNAHVQYLKDAVDPVKGPATMGTSF